MSSLSALLWGRRACLPSGSGWPYRGQSPIFPDVAVGWGNFVTAAPAALPNVKTQQQHPRREDEQGARRQNTATKTKATKGERTDDTRLVWDRGRRGRTDDGVSRKDGRTARSPWEISAGKFMAEKSSSALFSLHLLFLLFFIFLTFSRPCQPPLFSFGVHHSKTCVSAKFLRMFDMKM